MTHTKRHIRAFHRAKDSGEFFWARGGKTNKTYVFAADMPLLEAFLAAKGKAPNKVKAPSIIKSRRPTNDTHVNETHVKNSMYVRDFLQKNGIYLSTAEELSQMVTIEEVEEGLSEGLTEGVLVKYLRGEYIEPVKVSRSAAPDYAQGQFADFWDT
jgi:hypothetical protein